MFSLVIPLFNEQKNIISLLDEINISLKNFHNYEIIIIVTTRLFLRSNTAAKLLQNYCNLQIENTQIRSLSAPTTSAMSYDRCKRIRRVRT